MNGEVYQIASIVSAAKKALKENRDITYSPQKYVQDILFRFVSVNGEEHYIAKNVSEWFEQLKQRKIEEIKLLLPYEVKDRSRLGFSNQSGSMILCFYQDGQVTFFKPYWEFGDKARMWTIYYTENVWENPPANKPNFPNNENELKKCLEEARDLAEKIDCGHFATIFAKAIEVLEKKDEGPDRGYGLVLPQLPEEHLRIFEAVSQADVFGAMGSWNDEPPYMAQQKGLGDEYDRISQELFKNNRLALLYAVNEW